MPNKYKPLYVSVHIDSIGIPDGKNSFKLHIHICKYIVFLYLGYQCS